LPAVGLHKGSVVERLPGQQAAQAQYLASRKLSEKPIL
jgi:hypothetical protein